ncbi:MAG: radical SAM protein [Peptococcaceae bacterium]|jgi:DNA repair photolyase|nr:radical SAM protein [Peptococcaceae bacterium]MDH7526225.1 radical SAM protein [Peptococcaceae bacterium]
MMGIYELVVRKTLLYKTGVEYGDYTINHVQGCSHGCLYPCYAFMMAKRFGKVRSYDEWINPRIVSNTIELLQCEIPKYRSKIKSVHLSFSTDPFMYGHQDICDLSLKIISLLNAEGIKCTALTKGVLPKELKNFYKKNEYGITLISLNENFREKYEPYSAEYEKRIESLKYLHENGCKTWVSIEPYPTPNIMSQDFVKILQAVDFVDKIIFGRLNYNPKVSAYRGHKEYYNKLSNLVMEFCSARGIEYHIKKGTVSD